VQGKLSRLKKAKVGLQQQQVTLEEQILILQNSSNTATKSGKARKFCDYSQLKQQYSENFTKRKGESPVHSYNKI
jgi:hypothetical protein